MKITDKGLQVLLSAENIRSVHMRGCPVTGEGLHPLINYSQQIQSLSLRYCENLTDLGLSTILNAVGRRLKHLDLKDSGISGNQFAELQVELTSLEKLELQGCTYLTDQGLTDILKKCGVALNHLDLSYTITSGAGLSELREKFPNLRILILMGCFHLTDQGLFIILNMCGAALNHLGVSGRNISGAGAGLSVFQEKFQNLEILQMFSCENLTDEGLLDILKMCGEALKQLDVSETFVSGAALSALQDRFPNLENIMMNKCKNLTDQGLTDILNMCGERLQMLDIRDTGVSFPLVESLRASRPNLFIAFDYEIVHIDD